MCGEDAGSELGTARRAVRVIQSVVEGEEELGMCLNSK